MTCIYFSHPCIGAKICLQNDEKPVLKHVKHFKGPSHKTCIMAKGIISVFQYSLTDYCGALS